MAPRKQHKTIEGTELKHCNKCNEWRELEQYNKSKQSWDGLRHYCKICLKVKRKNSKEQITKYNKKYWQKTKVQQTQKHKIWYSKNKEHIKQYNYKYRYESGKLEQIRKQNKEYCKKRRLDPKYQEYYKNYRKKYDKMKRKTDINFKLKQNISRRIRELIKKDYGTLEYCGCSISQFKNHLVSGFDDKMNWENYGTWHIDHIIPCTAWNLEDKFELFCCFNYRNLQPMWALENIIKGNKYNEKDKIEFKKLMKELI